MPSMTGMLKRRKRWVDAENVLLYSGNDGREEHCREPVEDEMVKPPASGGRIFLVDIAAGASATEIRDPQDVDCGRPVGTEAGEPADGHVSRLDERPDAHGNRTQCKQPQDGARDHQPRIGDDVIKRSTPCGLRNQAPRIVEADREEDDEQGHPAPQQPPVRGDE